MTLGTSLRLETGVGSGGGVRVGVGISHRQDPRARNPGLKALEHGCHRRDSTVARGPLTGSLPPGHTRGRASAGGRS